MAKLEPGAGSVAGQSAAGTPARGIAVLVGFYSVMIAGTATTIVIFGMAKKLGPGFSRAVAGISAVALAGFGAYLLCTAR